jgi:phosphoribosylanthranilate isomerase
MFLKTNVLVTNITNLSEARYCAGMGVQFLAFDPHTIDPQIVKDITGWLQGPEFGIDISANAELQTNINEYSYTFIVLRVDQLGLSVVGQCHRLFVKGNLANISAVVSESKAKFIIAEDWTVEELKSAPINTMVSIANAELVDGYLTLPLAGFMLTGTSESKPGLMEYEHLSAVLEKLEVD